MRRLLVLLRLSLEVGARDIVEQEFKTHPEPGTVSFHQMLTKCILVNVKHVESSSTFARQSLVEFAHSSLRFSSWPRTFFDLHMPQDSNADRPNYSVLRKLAFKWLRIIYRCWQTRTPYDEARYLESLRRSGSPICHHLQQMNSIATTRSRVARNISSPAATGLF